MISQDIFTGGGRRWVFFGRDENKPDSIIDTNQYLFLNNGKALLLDPGGLEIFPEFVASLSKEIEMENIEAIFASHQDPDIVSSLSLWLEIAPQADVYVPEIWSTFIPHFGASKELKSIPDEGMVLSIGGSAELQIIPAHYVHSSGNYSLYDPVAKILWSGDIGAALLPKDQNEIFVEDFNKHTQYMEGFHKRWMPSNEAKNNWIKRVRGLEIEKMCPQHGAIFKGEDVQKFFDWFEALEVGSAIDL